MATRRSAGFSLIEMMAVVAIAGILAVFALPSIGDMIGRTRLKTAASDLHSALNLARSEAVKRNTAITVSPIGGGTNWAVGWQVKTGTTVLATQDPYTNLTFTTMDAAYSAASTVSTVTYTGTGRASPSVAYVITAPGVRGASARCVVIDPSGRPTVRMDNNGNAADGCN